MEHLIYGKKACEKGICIPQGNVPGSAGLPWSQAPQIRLEGKHRAGFESDCASQCVLCKLITFLSVPWFRVYWREPLTTQQQHQSPVCLFRHFLSKFQLTTNRQLLLRQVICSINYTCVPMGSGSTGRDGVGRSSGESCRHGFLDLGTCISAGEG